MSRETSVQRSITDRHATSWADWQSALYLFVLGCICVLLVPLTSFWWIFPVLGVVGPVALAVLDRRGFLFRRPGDRKVKERELLEALVEGGELSPTAAAVTTSLTLDEATKMLEELARKGHLKLRVESGTTGYALRDGQDAVDDAAPFLAGPESDGAERRFGAPIQLEEPLSERELEVLSLLASGRTNSEVARDLFVSVGTVKSHAGNIYRKLEAKNRTEALARARELRLLR